MATLHYGLLFFLYSFFQSRPAFSCRTYCSSKKCKCRNTPLLSGFKGIALKTDVYWKHVEKYMTTRSDSLTFGEKMLQQTAAVWHIPKSCFFLLFFLSNFTFQWIAFGSWVEGISVPQWYCLRKESVCQIWNQIIAVTIIKLRKAALLSPLHLYYIHEVARSQLLETRGKRIVSSRRYNTHKMLKSSCVPSKIPCVCTFPCALMFPGLAACQLYCPRSSLFFVIPDTADDFIFQN